MQFRLNVFTDDDRAFFLEMIEEAVSNPVTRRSVEYHVPQAPTKGNGVVTTSTQPIAIDAFLGSPAKGQAAEVELGRRTYVALSTSFEEASPAHDPELDAGTGAFIREGSIEWTVEDVQKGDLGESLYYVFTVRRS